MFFESSYYASPHIEDLLKKDDVQLVEFLDDDEILQEYKSQNKQLVQFFQRPDIVEQLVTMIITEPPGDVADAVRFKHPNIACEILTTETPDMTERLIENQPVLQKLYSFLEQEAPLNPLLTSFFSKTFGMLIVKKTEQNWFSYQCVCIQVLEFIKSRERFLETMFRHVGTPAIMDLLFQIIVNVEGPDLKNNLFNWLNEQKMVPRLINILGCDSDPEKHHNVAQFVCDLITHSRSFRQTDVVERGVHKQQQDEVGMSLLHAFEAPMVTSSLLEIVLMDSNRESTIVAGIRIVLKLLEKPIINERDVSVAQMVQLTEDEHRKKLLDRLLPQVAQRVRDFHRLLLNPPPRAAIQNTVALLEPPFGHTRLQVCIMLTVLLQTENAAIERAICCTEFFVTLITLFKQYCWNNLLHNQVRSCLVYALTPSGAGDTPISALQTHIINKCKIVAKLIDCWMHNNEYQRSSAKKGARLGYMGQLIEIFDALTTACRVHHTYRALVEDSLTAEQLADWRTITGVPQQTAAAEGAAVIEAPTPDDNAANDTATTEADVDAAAAAASLSASIAAVAAIAAAADAAAVSTAEPPVAVAAEAEATTESNDAAAVANALVVVPAAIGGELAAELKLQRTLLAGIDPYEKDVSLFHNSEYDQDFNVDPEASERFAQACKSKDLNSVNIDDILSDMLNIDDCDLFTMHGDGGANDDEDFDDNDDDDNDDDDDESNTNRQTRLRQRQQRQRNNAVNNGVDYDRDGSGGSDDDNDYDPRRIHHNGFDDDDANDEQLNNAERNDDDDDEDNDDDDDDDDVQSVNRSYRRQRHQQMISGLQQRTSRASAAARSNQLRFDAGDDNANSLNFGDDDADVATAVSSTFDISPWDTPTSGNDSNGSSAANTGSTAGNAAAFCGANGAAMAVDFASTSFFSGELNFQAHFPSTAATTATGAELPPPSAAGVSAVFDPVDPFGSATFATFADFGETAATAEAAAQEAVVRQMDALSVADATAVLPVGAAAAQKRETAGLTEANGAVPATDAAAAAAAAVVVAENAGQKIIESID